MAQRLVRKLCHGLRAAAQPQASACTENSRWRRRRAAIDLSNSREPVGCEACAGTGYRGRTTISELLMVDDGIREAIGRRSQDQRLIEQLARDDRDFARSMKMDWSRSARARRP